ncbi:hypothetical protein [Caldimonas sp. KR1-144]|uniref:hypothetical protein n=1 Tax=Caldimonas sp. KR1-144 TaxID=3400911 RepID=UPI003C07EA9E
MNLHASLRLANAMSLGLVLCAGLAACGGDTDHPKTLDALRADAEAVSAGRTPASAPRLVADQAASARDAF